VRGALIVWSPVRMTSNPAISNAIRRLDTLASVGLSDREHDSYLATVADMLRDQATSTEDVQKRATALVAALIDGAWRRAVDLQSPSSLSTRPCAWRAGQRWQSRASSGHL
jgi:hypothetical protein